MSKHSIGIVFPAISNIASTLLGLNACLRKKVAVVQRFVITVLKTFTKPSAQLTDIIPNHIPVRLQIGSNEVGLT